MFPNVILGVPGGTMVKNLLANAGDPRDVGSILGSERSPGVGNGNPLQYSCLRNPMHRGACWATVHGVADSDTTKCTHTHTHNVLSGDGEESGEGKGSRFWPTAFLDSSDLFSP